MGIHYTFHRLGRYKLPYLTISKAVPTYLYEVLVTVRMSFALNLCNLIFLLLVSIVCSAAVARRRFV